jgi:uncharacterized protein (DUF1800 family)
MVQSPARLEAALALSRFGLGARLDDIEAIATDPRGALKDEITRRLVPAPAGDELLSSRDLLKEWYAFNDMQREQRAQKAGGAPPPVGAAPQPPAPAAAPDMAGGQAAPAPSPATAAAAPDPKAGPPVPQRVFLAEAKARFSGTIHAPRIGFGERLAMFFANHFAISANKGPQVRILAGAFEREAIRPNVLGRFADMLMAVETHPAMLFFLDNQQSIGPNSRAAQRTGRGLNENLGREILELHTLGVDGGYTQADVTSLAHMITGWTVVGREGRLGEPGTFTFFANAHEPGSQPLLGKTYADGGFDQGRAALLDLARHPATAKHIATKLARHFVSDTPPPSLVGRLTKTFRDSDGDLAAVATALVDAPESWGQDLNKLRSPLEFSVAILRATGAKPEAQPVLGGLYVMGQPFWQPAGPNGFPDTTEAWASPEGLKMRMDVANAAAAKGADYFDPPEFIEARLGPLLSADTRSAVARAESRAQGLAIAFMSPEFQRR